MSIYLMPRIIIVVLTFIPQFFYIKYVFCTNSSLDVEQGEFSDSEILVLLGENGTGKTTYIRMMAGKLEPDSGTGK